MFSFLFIQHTMSDSFTKKTVAAPHTLVKIVSNEKVRVVNEGAFNKFVKRPR